MPTATFDFAISNRVPLGEKNQKTVRYYGSIVFSAATDTYLTGGLLPTTGEGLPELGPYGDRVPLKVDVFSRSGSGFTYAWNQATGKLMVFASAAGSGTAGAGEVTTGTALNATTPSIAADDVGFEAVFPTGN
jgi:hypothetical protein